MQKKLFINNLAFDVDSDQLVSIFAEYGTVQSADIVLDRNAGRSKGFAFVEMSSAEEAQKVIQKLNGKALAGQTIDISMAKPEDRRGPLIKRISDYF